MQTRKAPESEAILTGQPLEAERKYGLVGEQVVVGSRGGGNEDGTKISLCAASPIDMISHSLTGIASSLEQAIIGRLIGSGTRDLKFTRLADAMAGFPHYGGYSYLSLVTPAPDTSCQSPTQAIIVSSKFGLASSRYACKSIKFGINLILPSCDGASHVKIGEARGEAV